LGDGAGLVLGVGGHSAAPFAFVSARIWSIGIGQSAMVGGVDQLQIFWSVVGFYSVDVVNVFACFELPSQNAFHYIPMLRCWVFGSIGKPNVSVDISLVADSPMAHFFDTATIEVVSAFSRAEARCIRVRMKLFFADNTRSRLSFSLPFATDSTIGTVDAFHGTVNRLVEARVKHFSADNAWLWVALAHLVNYPTQGIISARYLCGRFHFTNIPVCLEQINIIVDSWLRGDELRLFKRVGNHAPGAAALLVKEPVEVAVGWAVGNGEGTP